MIAVCVKILLMEPRLNAVSRLFGRLASRSAIPYARWKTGLPLFAKTTTPEKSPERLMLSSEKESRLISSCSGIGAGLEPVEGGGGYCCADATPQKTKTKPMRLRWL